MVVKGGSFRSALPAVGSRWDGQPYGRRGYAKSSAGLRFGERQAGVFEVSDGRAQGVGFPCGPKGLRV